MVLKEKYSRVIKKRHSHFTFLDYCLFQNVVKYVLNGGSRMTLGGVDFVNGGGGGSIKSLKVLMVEVKVFTFVLLAYFN